MVVAMTTYPLWSGFNSHDIDGVEINGAAPTPGIVTPGVDTSIIARHERHNVHAISEERRTLVIAEQRYIEALPEVRYDFSSDRSHKTYPYRRVR
jgi:hypothetical protein